MVEVSPAQKEKLDALRRKFGITFIVAFGSRVKGVTHARSDLDIGILCARGFDTGILGELQGTFPGEDVDVALLNRADPLLLKGVSDAAVLLSGKSGTCRNSACTLSEDTWSTARSSRWKSG